MPRDKWINDVRLDRRAFPNDYPFVFMHVHMTHIDPPWRKRSELLDVEIFRETVGLWCRPICQCRKFSESPETTHL